MKVTVKISGESYALSNNLLLIKIFREPEYVELESTDEYVKVPVRIGPDKTYQ